jgi:hypothetical protein
VCRCGSVPRACGWSRSWRVARSRGCADSTGAGFAVVEVAVRSADRKSKVTMQLWLEPEQISTDAAGLEQFLGRRRPHSR